RAALREGIGERDQRQAVVSLCQQVGRSIGRAVVDHDDLVQRLLPFQRGKSQAQPRSLVARTYHDARPHAAALAGARQPASSRILTTSPATAAQPLAVRTTASRFARSTPRRATTPSTSTI